MHSRLGEMVMAVVRVLLQFAVRHPMSLTTLGLFALLAHASPVQAVSISWATIGDPGNFNGPESFGRVFGAVDYVYRIGKYEVTDSQYTEFLNAKDSAGLNPFGLYNTKMTTDANGGINFDPQAANGSKYSVKSGYANRPVNFVSWFDAARFTNWLNNGQGNSDTETGAYTLIGGTTIPTSAKSIVRNAGARFALPTENEWYKAAYYDPSKAGGPGYWTYPTRTDIVPASSFPGATPNTANVIGNGFALTPGAGAGPLDIVPGVNYLTDVGAYTASSNYYGTFDQSGNVYEWDEALMMPDYPNPAGVRGVMGGSFYNVGEYATNLGWFASQATVENVGQGFRVVGLGIPDSLQPGDFDSDGDVDGADFVIWQTNFPSATGHTLATGDADADGDVDGADFVGWLTNFTHSPTTASAVPEPASWILGFVMAGFVAGLRRRVH